MDSVWMDESLGSGLLAICVLNLFGSDSDKEGYKKGVMSNNITPFHFPFLKRCADPILTPSITWGG